MMIYISNNRCTGLCKKRLTKIKHSAVTSSTKQCPQPLPALEFTFLKQHFSLHSVLPLIFLQVWCKTRGWENKATKISYLWEPFYQNRIMIICLTWWCPDRALPFKLSGLGVTLSLTINWQISALQARHKSRCDQSPNSHHNLQRARGNPKIPIHDILIPFLQELTMNSPKWDRCSSPNGGRS